MTIIACQDCGHEIETSRTNTKYDSVCRLIRDLPYAQKRGEVECELCTDTFRPIDIHDTMCGRHAPRGEKYGSIECAFCGELRTRVRHEIDVCDYCARNAPIRKQFMAYLEGIQATRRGDEPQTQIDAPVPAPAAAYGDVIKYWVVKDAGDFGDETIGYMKPTTYTAKAFIEQAGRSYDFHQFGYRSKYHTLPELKTSIESSGFIAERA